MSAQSVSSIPATEGSLARHRSLSIPAVALLYGLVPLVGLAYLLFTSYSALAERTYSQANGVTGELLPHHSVGQSFVARYNGLSGVSLMVGTGAPQAPAGLTVHLRATPDGPDIAAAKIGVAQIRGANPWQTVSFPAIADSAGRTYFVKVESPDSAPGKAPVLFWWRPQPGGDTYPQGTAYVDGKAQQGDLAFGLRYSATPLESWLRIWDELPVSGPALLMLGALLLLVALGSALWMRAGQAGLARRALPILLGAALAHGLLYALLVPPWQGPDELSHFAYAALLDRHGLDNAAVQKLNWQGKDRDAALIDAISTAMTADRFTSYVAGYSQPGAPIVPAPEAVYSELRQPPAYYWLSAATWRIARHIGLSADPYSDPDGALRIMRLVSVLLSLGVVALAWLAGRLLAEPEGHRAWLPVLLPLSVLLLPMRAFADSVANNDVLAELAVSALVVAVIALLRWPRGLRGLLFMALVIVLAIVGSGTKSSALAAAVPLAGFALIVGTFSRWNVGTLIRKAPTRAVAVSGAALVALTVAALFLIPALYRPLGTAAGWKMGNQPIEKAPALVSASAHSGQRVLFLAKDLTASQQIELEMPHPDLQLSLSGFTRLHAANGTKAARAVARLEAAGVTATRADVNLGVDSGWQAFHVTLKIPAGVPEATVRLFARDGGVEFDDFSLSSDGVSPVASLLNPSFEREEAALARPIARFLPQEVQWIAEVAANPQTFDKPQIWGGYSNGQFRSFWGNFGWVSVPLPDAWFTFWLLVSGVALLGVVWKTVAGRESSSWRGNLRLVFLVGLALAIIFGFARQTMLLAVFNVGAYPQGRYLFALSIPVAYLFVSGLSAWAEIALRKAKGKRQKAESSLQTEGLWASAWVGVNLLAWFAAFALGTLIIPYFYS